MLLQGLILLVVGVSLVFLFLSLLVGVLTVSAKIIPRFNHLLPDDTARPSQRKTSVASGTKAGDEDVAVAIAVALARQMAAR